ncbi:unnamed protein product [Cuscuta europaea]|uniref:Uncharacterized protein n=1 Tax=Cuscuta europaea TaxID=41803 RepID=A0A9P0YS27_CUSEU|nr:unnamed protein product [Cuscuta europaea]
MERTGKTTKRNPTGRAQGGSDHGSKGTSSVSRGRGRAGHSLTVSDGHDETVDEHFESEEDSTYQPGTEPVETSYDGEDDDVSEESDDNDALERIEELLRQYQQDRQRRRARRALGGASRRRSHVSPRRHVESRGDRGVEVPIIRISKYLKKSWTPSNTFKRRGSGEERLLPDPVGRGSALPADYVQRGRHPPMQ